MLPIYICGSNDKRIADHIHTVREYMRKYRTTDIQIVCTGTNPVETLDYLQHHLQQSFYILDSHFDGPMNGIELAGEIRKADPRAYIIMMTDLPDEVTFTHHTEAMDRIESQSPDATRRIYGCLDNARILHHRFYHPHEEQVVNLVLGDEHFPFPAADLLYINTNREMSHGIVLHTDSNSYKYRGLLDKIAPVLDYTFRRCHKSYIVNMQHVNGMDKTHLTLQLDNGDEIPVSHRAAREIEQYLLLLNK